MLETLRRDLLDEGLFLFSRREQSEGSMRARLDPFTTTVSFGGNVLGDRKPQLLSFTVSSNHVEGLTWKITGTWCFCAKDNEARKPWYARLLERVTL
jgi:hypothetical protein